MSHIHNFILQKKYEILLVSLLLLLFGKLLVPNDSNINWQWALTFQNVIAGLFLFSNKPRWKWILISISVVIVASEIMSSIFHWQLGGTLSGGLYIIYFFLISIKVYHSIFKAKEVNSEVIAAVLCGFIMLAIIGSMIFMIVEVASPPSFSNLGSGFDKFQNLQYFSFITTLTIGYGDIVPLTITAKKVTMFMGLIGNFYTVFVMGIIIGKFLKN